MGLRPDQIARIQDLQERLADVFLVEADPDNWNGAGKLPTEMSREERGDRHWDRKGAMGTGAVLKYTMDIVQHSTTGGGVEVSEDDLEDKIKQAEAKAKKALARVMNKSAGKDEYDKRIGAKG